MCGGCGVVWVIGWAMGVGVGGVNSFRPIYKGNPFIKILSPVAGAMKCSPKGSHLILLLFILGGGDGLF